MNPLKIVLSAVTIGKSPLVKELVLIAGEIVSGLPDGFVGSCFALIKFAQNSSELTDGPAKRNYVLNKLKEQFGEVGERTARIVIECSLDYIERGIG